MWVKNGVFLGIKCGLSRHQGPANIDSIYGHGSFFKKQL